ncbi:carbon-nitrogen hydrolase family protein [Arthrobacter cryoconiti]|uniref:Carbon-nitrogen hydrolase family protein n=1 Tax=Arthrobacter cryoconiti TaxID=748907 RepID=A0ABV8QXD9_9MICC|nr:carbon-nitrogen hydrolase family protein [Arthrobacter cryoconiti]MCC9067581.1 carbon-nitrogen hydrolase family protein [Arthrobacter cryoconiti]
MSRILPVIAAQAKPHLIGENLEAFEREVQALLAEMPEAKLVIFPELHLFGDDLPDRLRNEALAESAEPLSGPRVKRLQEVAAKFKIWLVPGSVCERGENGELFNTQLVISPDGKLAAHYRKIFPWRPFEPYDPGHEFVTVDLEGYGRAGLNICYDAWFPEVTRQLAWMGAEVIINVVKTTTTDREQELVLARANAIVNQVFMISVNCAAPTGQGQSIIVDPEGHVITEAATAEATVLTAHLDLSAVEHVRNNGTAGLNRMWSQFRPGEHAIELPIYQGRIDPATWNPNSRSKRSTP